MSERRIVMTSEQHEDLELYILALMRSGQREQAQRMMNLTLAYKFARDLEPSLPSNVYPIIKHAGDDWSRRVTTS
jgi:hypothetical protein